MFVVNLFLVARLGAERWEGWRLYWSNRRRIKWTNPRRTNRGNIYGALAKRDYFAVDTPTFTPSVSSSRHHEISQAENCSPNGYGKYTWRKFLTHTPPPSEHFKPLLILLSLCCKRAKGRPARKNPLSPFSAKKVHSYTTMCSPYLSSTCLHATPFVEINQPFLHQDLVETPKPTPCGVRHCWKDFSATTLFSFLIFNKSILDIKE